MQGKIRGFLSRGVDLILPPRCVVTGEAVELQGMIAPSAWQSLDFITDPVCRTCGLPFDFSTEGDLLCAACIKEPPSFETARSALKYNDTSREIILGFKHADKTHVVQAFLPWLSRAGGGLLSEADFILPVPLHYRRLVARRYNQSMLIAQALAHHKGIRLLPDAIKRMRHTPSQGHLDFKERRKNVKGAFSLHKKYREAISGKSLLLIDDVYTTGSTVNECAKTLIKSGARQVNVLTLARVVRGDF